MSRRLLFTVCAAALLLGAPTSVGATDSPLDFESAVDAMLAVDPTLEPPANDPGKDFAVGGFQHNFRNNKIGFSGQSGPLGESPWGHLSETIPTPGGFQQARFRVVCVAVAGKTAALGLMPSEAKGNDQHNPFVLTVLDGGSGGTGDLFAFVGDIAPADCALGFLFAPPVFPIDSGNILVHDALP